MKHLVWITVLALGASVGGNRAPDGTEIQIDLPGDLHRKNTTSRGQGCCVWTSIHHSALWQNVPAYLEAPKWIQEKNIAGGAHSGSVERYLPQMAKERGYPEVPQFINYEGNDLELLKLACKSGRAPAVTYCFSPTGRYGGKRISHMVSCFHCDEKWVGIVDNNFPKTVEWLTPEEFKKTWTCNGTAWTVILLNPPPAPPPHN